MYRLLYLNLTFSYFSSEARRSHFGPEEFIGSVQVVQRSPRPNGETFGGRLVVEIVTYRWGERKQSVAAVIVERPENAPTEPQPLGKEMGICEQQTHGDGEKLK